MAHRSRGIPRRTARPGEQARTVRAADLSRQAPGPDPLRAVAFAPRPIVGWQRWDEILFLHWVVPPETLRPLVDPRLALDLHDGLTWVSLTPFTLRGGRVRFLPRLPWLTEFHELNLRTYVRAGGVPGLWFLSLDAASAPACAVARATLGLPYFRARMRRSEAGGWHAYRSERLPPGPAAAFEVRWRARDPLPSPEGSLDHFLAERYALYSVLGGRLVRVRVRHAPWALAAADVDALSETVTRAAGLPAPGGPPIARASRGEDVAVLAPERVG